MTAMNNPPPQNPPPLVAPPPVHAAETGASGSAMAAACPMTSEQMQQVTLARQRAGKLRRAAGIALFNGIWLGVFSGLSLMFVAGGAIFGEFDGIGAIMCIGLGVLAWNELRGRKMLLQYHPRSTVVLGWNQLALLGLIVAYAAWMLSVAVFGTNPYEEAMRSQPLTAQVFGDVSRLYRILSLALYGGLIVGSVIFQGLNSLYYFTRVKLLRAYLAETPDWVVELQRRQAGGR